MSAHLKPRGALRAWEGRFGPNMTPMIDVVLVILIFFMGASTFLGKEWFIKSELVQKGKAAADKDPLRLPPTRITLRLSRSQGGAPAVTGMGSATLDLPGFAARIREFAAGTEKSDIVVIVQPDADVNYDDVVKVHEACLAAGIERVALSVSP